MKQTAVDIFFEELKSLGFIDNENDFLLLDRLKQAKELEKQQIIEAHIAGQEEVLSKPEDAEFYFNETYNQKT